MKIDLYYDGVDIDENCGEEIDGFTTNISFLRSGGIVDYESFILKSLQHSNGRPISFQLFDDNDSDIEKTAKKISSFDDSIFVKIPVVKTSGEYNSEIISKLHEDGVKINVTAIFTIEQIGSLITAFGISTPVIISIFAGRINDCGLDSTETVTHAKETFRDYPNVKILWAACRTVYNVIEAEKQGADIVTVPGSVLKRIHRLGDDPGQASIDAVEQFRRDGLDGKIKLE